MPRWRLACDACRAGGWIGPRPSGPRGMRDAWCEGCQTPHPLRGAPPRTPACPRCRGRLTLEGPRFEELQGEAQNIAAVLAAWAGDPMPLSTLLPERPVFLTDLGPPEPRDGDPPAARSGLEALLRGDFARAREHLAGAVRRAGDRGHLWRGLAIAAQRLGEPGAAEEAFGRALEVDPHDTAARLDRGVLRARRGDHAGARADLALAGDRREARWNRAALLLIEAVRTGPGLPPAAVVRRARAEAGKPSSYWSDHTVGRLLWTLLVERARARASHGGPARGEARTLQAAEALLEFETFWDRALVVHGYAALGLARPAGRVAAPLAGERLQSLRREPFARGPAGAWLAVPLTEAAEAARKGRPAEALVALAAVLERAEVRRYRVPCLACGRGSLGVASYQETEGRA